MLKVVEAMNSILIRGQSRNSIKANKKLPRDKQKSIQIIKCNKFDTGCVNRNLNSHISSINNPNYTTNSDVMSSHDAMNKFMKSMNRLQYLKISSRPKQSIANNYRYTTEATGNSTLTSGKFKSWVKSTIKESAKFTEEYPFEGFIIGIVVIVVFLILLDKVYSTTLRILFGIPTAIMVMLVAPIMAALVLFTFLITFGDEFLVDVEKKFKKWLDSINNGTN